MKHWKRKLPKYWALLTFQRRQSQAKEAVQVGNGYIYESKFRAIVPFVVGHNGEARWGFLSWTAVPRWRTFRLGWC